MSLKKFRLVGLDTNIFSYHLHKHPAFGPLAKEVFDALSVNKLHAVTSIITLTEVLSVKVLHNQLKELENNFSETPNLLVLDVNYEIATKAASIRRKYGFRLPDAIQLATSLTGRANAFITNDENLMKFGQMKILLLSSLR